MEIYGSLWSEGTTTAAREESQKAIDFNNLICVCIWDEAWDVVIDTSVVELYCLFFVMFTVLNKDKNG